MITHDVEDSGPYWGNDMKKKKPKINVHNQLQNTHH